MYKGNFISCLLIQSGAIPLWHIPSLIYILDAVSRSYLYISLSFVMLNWWLW